MSLPAAPSAFSGSKHGLALAFICLGLLLSAPHATAQAVDATELGFPRLDLAAGWLVHAGDDPEYAQPGFDDSHWTPFNAATDSLHTLFPHSMPAVVWYRIHVKVRPGERYLDLRERQISRAFVVYTNGVPLIHAGSVTPFVPYYTFGWIGGKIPDNQVATGSIVIAVRARLTPVDWSDGQPGLMDWKLSLGNGLGLRENTWLQLLGTGVLNWLNDCILLCLVVGALLLYFAQRSQVEYLWLAAVGVVDLLTLPLEFYGLLHTFPMSWWFVPGAVGDLLLPYLYARMYLAFVRRPLGWRLHAYLVFASVSYAVARLLYDGGWATADGITLLSAPALVLSSVILPVIMIAQARRGNREAGILLVPLLLRGVYEYVYWGAIVLVQIPSLRSSAWSVFRALFYTPIGPFSPQFNQIPELLAWISLALIILLRTGRTSRREALLEAELANARAVQQVILPEQVETIPGFEIESVYEPAQQVGGDFFQVMPAGEGGVLLVLGDVAGKGLPAAMMVSVLVGAIRTVATYSHNPDEVLAQLNERLIGRAQGGFSTAMAVHIASDGAVALANAGHLPPYLDGREIELPGVLPLGVTGGARYETVRFRLKPGSRLTFYSDGVIEARNQQGELFGFERGRALSTQPAAAIAEAAKLFGQSDDITVVTIRRTVAVLTPTRANAAQPQPVELQPSLT